VKIFRFLAFLGIAAAVIVFPCRRATIFAAGSPSAQASTPSSDAATAPGAKVFLGNCSMCHGEKMDGHPPMFPSLVGAGKKLNSDQIRELVRHGHGNMPAFASSRISDADLAALLQYLAASPIFTPPSAPTQAAPAPAAPAPTAASSMSAAAASPHAPTGPGASLYLQNCAFCHGRDAGGGESGPDLTRSKLVAQDVNGSTIGPVVRNGRGEGKMPKFNFSDAEMTELVAFIHSQAKQAATRPGGRRGVDVADLQTGNVEAGKAYFYGAGGCSKCHSPTGDLAGVASRYEGLKLEEQMLYPGNATDTLIVTLPSGETVKGRLAYQDEFTVGMRDASGTYRSWPTNAVKYSIDSPVAAHVDQFPKYTDDDIHNLMAYIQTMK
jgi:cytochrome c oxidase cbb3-type subunit 3